MPRDTRPMHELSAQEQWSLVKQERLARAWNADARRRNPSADKIPFGRRVSTHGQRTRKETGIPSSELEHTQGIVT